MAKSRHREALQACQHATVLNPEHPDVLTQIQEIESIISAERELDALFDQAMTAHDRGDWYDAQLRCIDLIKRDCLKRRDIDIPEMLVKARRVLDNQVEAEEKTYQDGKNEYDARNWREAIIILEGLPGARIEKRMPNSSELLSSARKRLRLEEDTSYETLEKVYDDSNARSSNTKIDEQEKTWPTIVSGALIDTFVIMLVDLRLGPPPHIQYTIIAVYLFVSFI